MKSTCLALAMVTLTAAAGAQNATPKIHILFERQTALHTYWSANVKQADGVEYGVEVNCLTKNAVMLDKLMEAAVLASGHPLAHAMMKRAEQKGCTVTKESYHFAFGSDGQLVHVNNSN